MNVFLSYFDIFRLLNNYKKNFVKNKNSQKPLFFFLRFGSLDKNWRFAVVLVVKIHRLLELD
jgi:hypothetical protein